MSNKLVKSFLLIIIGLGLFIACIAYMGVPDWSLLLGAHWAWLWLGFLFVAASVFAISWRWRIILFFFDCHPKLSAVFGALSVIGFSGSILPKDLTELVGRSWWLKHRFNVDYRSGIASIVVDRFMDVYVLASILPACFIFMFDGIELLWAIAALCLSVMLAGLLLLGAGNYVFFLFNLVLSGLKKIWNKIVKKNKAVQPVSVFPVIPRAVLLHAFAATIIKFFLVSAYYWFFACAINIDMPLWVFIMVVPVIQLTFVFSFTAGGLGILEMGWLAVLQFTSMSASEISTYLLAQRLYLTLSLALIALIVVIKDRILFARVSTNGPDGKA